MSSSYSLQSISWVFSLWSQCKYSASVLNSSFKNSGEQSSIYFVPSLQTAWNEIFPLKSPMSPSCCLASYCCCIRLRPFRLQWVTLENVLLMTLVLQFSGFFCIYIAIINPCLLMFYGKRQVRKLYGDEVITSFSSPWRQDYVIIITALIGVSSAALVLMQMIQKGL